MSSIRQMSTESKNSESLHPGDANRFWTCFNSMSERSTAARTPPEILDPLDVKTV